MKHLLPRRGFLHGALAAAAVAYFPEAKSWGGPGQGGIQIPSLDGQLLADAATLAQAADDFGHIVHRTPTAVLVPGSVEDIVKMIKFAHAHGIKVAGARGIGASHSTQGQSQVQAGVVIDMSALNTIHSVGANVADVDAGVRWSALLEQTVPLGKSPPTLTDYIELSVGGTLSVGGIGGQAHQHGLQVDNVLELDVVTGRGHLVTCSPTENALLFAAVRAGLGQFGIIVRARIRLVDVAPMARTYTASYSDVTVFTNDQLAAIDSGRFDYVEGSVAFGAGGWGYSIELVKYFDPASPPDDAAMLAGLNFLPGTNAASDSTYFDFANRLAPTWAFLQSIGALDVPHAWLNLFVPGPDVASFVQSVLSQTTPDDTGNGPVLLYPFKPSKLTAPFFRVPCTERVFIFSLLRFAFPPTPDVVAAQIASNRAFFDANTAIGGKRYPIDSVPMSHADWVQHFDPLWDAFAAAKDLYDPHGVLTPGQGIF